MEASSCPKYEDYRGVMIDIALEDTSLDEPDLVDEVRRHIRVCPHCQREFNGYRRVVTLFTPPPVFEEEIEEIAANVRRRVLAKVTAYERRRRLLRWSVAVACVAALAALAVGIAPLLSRQAAESTPTSQAPEAKAHQSVSPTTALQAVVIPAKKEQPAPVLVTSKPITPEQRAKLDEAKRLREEGQRLVRVRDFKKAEAPLRKAIRAMQALVVEAPGTEAAMAALYEQYRCQELLGNVASGEAAFTSYIRARQHREGADAAAHSLVVDAHRLIGAGKTDLAGRRLESAVALSPRGSLAVAAHVLLAVAAESDGLLDLAHSQYRAAADLRPSPPLIVKLYRNMINIDVRLGRLDAAIREAERLCALKDEAIPPEERVVHGCLLARLHDLHGDRNMAIRVLRELIATYMPDYTRYAQLQLAQIVGALVDREAIQ